MDDELWKPASEQEFIGERANRIGAVNMALLFGTAAIALTLILTPVFSSTGKNAQLEASTMDYDNITTGSIPSKDGKVKRYTIRRSVLQSDPGDVCIIQANGDRNGC